MPARRFVGHGNGLLAAEAEILEDFIGEVDKIPAHLFPFAITLPIEDKGCAHGAFFTVGPDGLNTFWREGKRAQVAITKAGMGDD